MTIKIEKKIAKYAVANKEEEAARAQEAAAAAAAKKLKATDNIVHMHEKLERPDILIGSTYKVKTPLSEHALYVTINDIILNEGTEHEHRRPFEVFINSKNMDHFQWIVALTRIISAVFRKGGDVTFLVEELRSVFDPSGGYFKKGGKYVPSLVAEIGDVICDHMQSIGLIKPEGLSEHQQKILNEKRAEYEATVTKTESKADNSDCKEEAKGDFPPGAELCKKCNTKAMIQMDGCLTCLNCGESKCG